MISTLKGWSARRARASSRATSSRTKGWFDFTIWRIRRSILASSAGPIDSPSGSPTVVPSGRVSLGIPEGYRPPPPRRSFVRDRFEHVDLRRSSRRPYGRHDSEQRGDDEHPDQLTDRDRQPVDPDPGE